MIPLKIIRMKEEAKFGQNAIMASKSYGRARPDKGQKGAKGKILF